MFGEAAMAALRAAVVALGWRPAEFWAATPAELVAALEAQLGSMGGEAPLGRDELARLIGENGDGR